MTPVLLDHTALLVLAKGHRQLSGFVVAAAGGRGVLQVPALSLTVAGREREYLAEHVASLPGVEIEPLDLPAALAAGDLLRAGTDWRVTQAVHLARPTLDHPGGRPLISFEPGLYAGTGIAPITPGGN
ncbi:hypothetical protein [Yinghuangia sp. YIM S09857]|uniref:hypothetical protein n=1 Tax=Yinghuangia sp. YIM S09857 TaxID=3436929 RepID=UPI003F536E5D